MELPDDQPYLQESQAALIVSRSLHLRRLYAYTLSAVPIVIELVTFLFMLRMI